LRGGFVDNRVNPALFSPAALNLVKYLPKTTDPCGQVTYTLRGDSDERQYVSRVDYQRTSNDTIFGRYMATKFDKPIPMREGDTPLSLYDAANNTNVLGFDALAHSLAIGDTRVYGSNTVNAIHFTYNRSGVYRLRAADVRAARHRVGCLQLCAACRGLHRVGQRVPDQQPWSRAASRCRPRR
jgi:hypothetical protein